MESYNFLIFNCIRWDFKVPINKPFLEKNLSLSAIIFKIHVHADTVLKEQKKFFHAK